MQHSAKSRTYCSSAAFAHHGTCAVASLSNRVVGWYSKTPGLLDSPVPQDSCNEHKVIPPQNTEDCSVQKIQTAGILQLFLFRKRLKTIIEPFLQNSMGKYWISLTDLGYMFIQQFFRLRTLLRVFLSRNHKQFRKTAERKTGQCLLIKWNSLAANVSLCTLGLLNSHTGHQSLLPTTQIRGTRAEGVGEQSAWLVILAKCKSGWRK